MARRLKKLHTDYVLGKHPSGKGDINVRSFVHPTVHLVSLQKRVLSTEWAELRLRTMQTKCKGIRKTLHLSLLLNIDVTQMQAPLKQI
jgi:hypothetical protein